MTIKVFPSLLPGEPLEVHECAGCTIGEWLTFKNLAWEGRSYQPVQIKANGREITPHEWPDYEVVEDDDIEIRIVPQGDVFGAIGSIIGAVFDFALGWLMPNTGNVGRNQTPQGQQLESSNATANVAKLNGVVPEQAGVFRRFPEYLTPPRRYFENERENVVEFLCCIGPGRYQIAAADIKVGDTPIEALGEDAECFIFEPGANLSQVPAHLNWYTVEEVGGTSSGTAGLELSSTFSSQVNPTASAYSFNNRTISIAPGEGQFPDGWGTGTVIDIRLPQTYVVSLEEGETLPRNRFTGNFRELAPTIGMNVSAVGILPTASYSVAGASIGPDGIGWIELGYDYGTGTELVSSIPAGDRTITFWRAGRRYLVETTQEQAVTVSAFDGVGAEPGWAGFPAVTSAAATIATDPNTVYGDWSSLFSACPPNEATESIELDFFFPGGLAHISDDGDLEAKGVQVQIQYRDADLGGAFVSVSKSYVAATLDQIGYTERIGIARMRPEVRVRRVGAASTSTQDKDEVQWSGLKSNLGTRIAYPNWTVASVRLRGGGRLAARSENKFNVTGMRILPTLQADGTWLDAGEPTRDISAFVRYIATTIGYTDDQLDTNEFLRLDAIWKARGETVDFVFDQTTVAAAIKVALAAGMSEITISDGRIRPVRDDVRTVFEQPYSIENTLSGIARKFRTRKIDDYDGVEVEFIDAKTWAKSVVRCYLPGDEGFKLLKLKLDGVTDRARAWRIGMRQRRVLRYRRWSYGFDTEFDALNSEYLSYVPLIDDVPGYGTSTMIQHVAPLAGKCLLVGGEPLTWEPGESYVVAFRNPEGRLVGPFPAQPGIDTYSVLADIPQPWPVPTLDMELPHMFFGTLERWTFPALITDIRPNGLESVSVEAANYHPLVYADDNNFPPAAA